MRSSEIRRCMAASGAWFASSEPASTPASTIGATAATPASAVPPTCICARRSAGSGSLTSRCFACCRRMSSSKGRFRRGPMSFACRKGPGSASPCRGNAWPPVTGTSPRMDLATNTTTPRPGNLSPTAAQLGTKGSEPETAGDGWTGKDRMLQSRQTGRRSGRENGAIHKNP
jgi:hypothetical protein